jgi:magnesium transporter
MVMLSDFLRFTISDEHGRRAKLIDLAVDLAAGDYPPVTQLIIRGHGKHQEALHWEIVSAIDWRRHRIAASDLRVARAAPVEALKETVLLKRDIMDALVVDVAQRHTARANDLWLREEDGQLWLAGVDVSPYAVVRRLGRGLLGQGRARVLVEWEDVEFLRGDPRAALEGRDYHRTIARLQPAEIARLLDALPYIHAAELLSLIADPLAADTLEAMSTGRQVQVFSELDEDQCARLLGLMAPDLAADLLGQLKPERSEHLLQQVPRQQRDPIVELLRYPEDTAGGIMTNQIVVVPAHLTVGGVRRAYKEQFRVPDFVYYLYVVDHSDTNRLEGVVTLRDYATADDHERIADLMSRHITTVDALEPATEAAQRLVDQHLVALPVTGRDGRLVGAVTIDAAMALLAPRSWREEGPRIFS